MSAVRVEAKAFTDDRFGVLAQHAGLADADHARGKMLRLWSHCTEHCTYHVTDDLVRVVLGPSGVDALLRSELGVRADDDHIRICGTEGRVEWLKSCRDNGKKGGRPSKKSKRDKADTNRNRTVKAPVGVGFDSEEREQELERERVALSADGRDHHRDQEGHQVMEPTRPRCSGLCVVDRMGHVVNYDDRCPEHGAH